MKKTLFTILFVAVATPALFAQNASLMGTSVYGTEQGQPMTLRNASFTYQQVNIAKTYKKYDLVTVLVNDNSDYKRNADMQRQKKNKLRMGLTDWVKIPGLTKLPEPVDTPLPYLGAEIDNQNRSKGQLSSSEKIIFKIQSRVESVLENGNLIITGQRNTKFGEETKVLYFSGEIRQEDISQKDNTISSDKVYNLVIDDTPSGNVYDSIRRGWGVKAVDQYGPM